MDRIGVAATHAVLVPWVALLSVLIVPAPVQAQTTVAGFTPGSFRVTESGAGAYRIPIRVPPGIAGMEPSLALAYNSQAGNGLLGVGWSLEGLSFITRCPRTVAQDGVVGGINYDLNDRYCLDGQKLMLIAGASYGADGAEYRTERESFAKILSNGTAGNGPAWFKVWTKSGQLIEYGNTADSRIEAQGKTSVRLWAVNRVSDTSGNYFTVTYTEDNPNGDFFPSRIDYTGNSGGGLVSTQSVRFTYQSRTDVTPLYIAGSVIKTMNRVTNVKTYVGETVVKDYQLVYDNLGTVGQSRVASAQECAADGSCLPAISATWLTETAATRNFNSAGSGNWTGPSTGGLVGDFNGDGKQDILGYSGGTTFDVCISNGTGFSCSAWNGASGLSDLKVGDFDGDGRSDVVGYHVTNESPPGEPAFYRVDVTVCFSAGSSFSCTLWSTLYTTKPFGTKFVGDFDGDGRSEWRMTSLAGALVGDFNGDGRADVVSYAFSGNNWNVCLSTGSGSSCSTWSGPSGPTDVAGDFNGDGLKDLAQYVSGNTWNVCLSTGTGFSCSNWIGVSVTAPSADTKVGDFNGDGKSDLAAQTSPGVWNVCLSTGSGFSCSDWSGTTATVGNTVVGDFDGDGKEDLSGRTSGSTWHTTLAGSPFPDRIQTVSNGLGGLTTLTYLPLTNSSVYTKDTTATYPTRDLQNAAYAVSSHTQSDGIGGNVQTNYTYTGAKADLTGRGFIGFKQIQSTFVPTGIQTLVTNRQDWPFVGLPSQAKRTRSNGAVLSQVDNTYDCNDFTAGCTVAVGKRYFPFVSQSDEVSYDLNAAFITKLRMTNQFDSFGNATQVVVTDLTEGGLATGYSKTTTNTYANDTVNWFLGRLTRSTVQSTTPP